MAIDLAARLREGTKDAHEQAENSGYMRAFVQGRVHRDAYARYVSGLYPVYTALEDALDANRAHPVVAPLYLPELHRRTALEADLAYFYGDAWRDAAPPSAGSAPYVARIREISATNPALLVAHSYTRYLGDLSGGQMLKKMTAKFLGLTSDAGLAFYEFPLIEAPGAFKGRYRDALNNLPIDEAGAEAVVAEASTAFTLNMRLFDALAVESGL